MVLIQTHIKTIKLEDANHNILGEIKFDMSDENVVELQKTVKRIEKEIKEHKVDDVEFGQFLKQTVDEILGEGTFDMLYQLSPSTILTAINFVKIAEEIQAEVVKTSTALTRQKYLGKKKRNRRGK